MSSSKPVRVQRKRTKGWKMPPNTIYVGRPTKYGNPYVPMLWGDTVDICIKRYEDNMSTELKQDIVANLKGANLACFCPLDKPCHADILLKLANQ